MCNPAGEAQRDPAASPSTTLPMFFPKHCTLVLSLAPHIACPNARLLPIYCRATLLGCPSQPCLRCTAVLLVAAVGQVLDQRHRQVLHTYLHMCGKRCTRHSSAKSSIERLAPCITGHAPQHIKVLCLPRASSRL